jgi:hypothetical protein
MLGISCLDEGILASQEGLCYVEMIRFKIPVLLPYSQALTLQ